MTAIAASAAIGRATGRSSRATASSTGRIRKSRRNIPTIPQAEFQRAVQYIAPDGHHASAAEASFLTLSHARGKGFWLALYRNAARFRGRLGMGLRVHRRAPPGFLPHQPAAVGQEPRAAALRSRLVPVPAAARARLPLSLRLLRRAGAGAHRQPWHPAGRRTRRRRHRAVSGRSASSWCRWCSG